MSYESYAASHFTLFTLSTTNSKQWLKVVGDLGNYDEMVANRVDRDLWQVVRVRYLGDEFSGIFPTTVTYADGYRKLVAAIESTVGKFALCGFGQGAAVCSMVYKEIMSGTLQHRRDDLVAGVMFGNPMREAGHTIPGGINPGGHGMFGPDYRLVGSESLWWDFANAGDPAACVGDMVLDQVIQACSDAIAFGDWDSTGGIIQWLNSLFTPDHPDWATLIPNAVEWINRVFISTTQIYLTDPVLNQEPHIRYHFPYAGLSGNSLSAVQLAVNYLNSIPPLLTPTYDFSSGLAGGGDQDRFRFIVEEAVTGEILSRDLVVQNPKLLRALSGPCAIEFDVDEHDPSTQGILFKPYGHIVHAEKTIMGQRQIWASAIVQPSEVDKKTGIMHLSSKGFSSYPKDIPWLQNWNPLVVDPFEVVQKIWSHVQSYPTGNLGVTVYPATSGIEMLPGYAFDGEITNVSFFAMFIRAADKQDCQDNIDKLARDIPFDYVEQSNWNSNRTAIDKYIYLGYPVAGIQQDNLVFAMNENVLEASPHVETEIDWVSDIIIDGWFPGSEHSAQISNADPHRFRRVISQDDARINSDERAAAWARRKLTRRQTPSYWDSIIVDMGHPNAPFGSYDVGDRIWVRGFMPWIGDVNQLHKILAISVDEKAGACELTLKAEGAYDYDPIYYQGDVDGSVVVIAYNAPAAYVAHGEGTVVIS